MLFTKASNLTPYLLKLRGKVNVLSDRRLRDLAVDDDVGHE